MPVLTEIDTGGDILETWFSGQPRQSRASHSGTSTATAIPSLFTRIRSIRTTRVRTLLMSAQSQLNLVPDGTLDSVVLANHAALATIQAPAPVLRGGDPAELVELPDFFQAHVDELPGAWHIRTDLAAVFL